MTVREIIIAYLEKHGYDGLCSEDCGCGTDDFAPCVSDYILGCKTAKKVMSTPEIRTKYNYDIEMCPEGEEIFVPAEEE